MLNNLITFLKYEESLMRQLVDLAEKQQRALIRFDASMLEEIASFQLEISKNLKQTEEQRIVMFMNWLSLSRKQATDLRLSAVEKYFTDQDTSELKKLRNIMGDLAERLKNFMILNRVLANRARNSVNEIMALLTNGTNQVCNVKI